MRVPKLLLPSDEHCKYRENFDICNFFIKIYAHDHPGAETAHQEGVFPGGREVVDLDVGGPGMVIDEQHEGNAQHDGEQKRDADAQRDALPFGIDGVEQKNQRNADRKGEQHVRGVVDAQIHPGEAHNGDEDNKQDTEPFLLAESGPGAKRSGDIRGVAAGKGIALGCGAGTLHDGEIRMRHPGTGDLTENFGKLIDIQAEEGDDQRVAAPLFADAPVDMKMKKY